MSDYVKELQAWIIQRQPNTRPPTKQEVLATFLGVQPLQKHELDGRPLLFLVHICLRLRSF